MTGNEIVLPDLGEELIAGLGLVEGMLLSARVWEAEDPELALPPPLQGGQALAAVRRLTEAIAPTQGDGARARGCTGRLLGADGRTEHVPVRIVAVDDGDVALVGDLAAVLADERASADVGDVLAFGALGAYGDDDSAGCERMADQVRRIAGLLELPANADSELMAEVAAGLAEPGSEDEDLVLDPRGEQAHARLAARWHEVWHRGEAIASLLY